MRVCDRWGVEGGEDQCCRIGLEGNGVEQMNQRQKKNLSQKEAIMLSKGMLGGEENWMRWVVSANMSGLAKTGMYEYETYLSTLLTHMINCPASLTALIFFISFIPFWLLSSSSSDSINSVLEGCFDLHPGHFLLCDTLASLGSLQLGPHILLVVSLALSICSTSIWCPLPW